MIKSLKCINFILLRAIFIFVMGISNSFAEYRAYQYLVSTNPEQKSTTILTTSLTPTAMTRYYGLSKQKLYLLRTWICPGHTGGKKTCNPPYLAQNLESFLLEEKPGEL